MVFVSADANWTSRKLLSVQKVVALSKIEDSQFNKIFEHQLIRKAECVPKWFWMCRKKIPNEVSYFHKMYWKYFTQNQLIKLIKYSKYSKIEKQKKKKTNKLIRTWNE